jgi:hypothetical protein
LKRRSFITGAGAALASSSLSSVCSFSQALASRSARHRLPFNDAHYQRVRSYIEDEPIPEVDLVFQCQAGIHGRFYAKDSASQPITTPVEMSANTTVYFYRCKQFVGSALAPSVFCDDSQLARMENGRFFVMGLVFPKAEHALNVDHPLESAAKLCCVIKRSSGNDGLSSSALV